MERRQGESSRQAIKDFFSLHRRGQQVGPSRQYFGGVGMQVTSAVLCTQLMPDIYSRTNGIFHVMVV